MNARSTSPPIARSLLAAAGLALCTAFAGASAAPAGGDQSTRSTFPVAIPPQKGALAISRSTRIEAGTYRRVDDRQSGVITISNARGVTLELEGVTLEGSAEPRLLDTAQGSAIVLRDCVDVTIRGGTLRGYHTAVRAERCRGLVIEGLTVDGTYAERLHSTLAVESEEDWIDWPAPGASFAPQMGAALRLVDCSDVTIRNCGARHGQNGLLLERGANVRFYRNDFSFLSGWGFAGLDVRGLVCSHNRLDYCLRGYSREHYASGQNSAAFALIGDCREVVFAKNSALRAGTAVVLRGLPAREDQGPPAPQALVWGNDFSGAVAGGVDVRDSANVWVVGNLFELCGPSAIRGQRLSDSLFGDNTLNGVPGSAIALADARRTLIVRNVMHGSEVGLEVWTSDEALARSSRAEQAAQRSSESLWVARNSFAQNDSDLGLRDVRSLWFADNVFQAQGRNLAIAELEPDPGVPKLLLEGRDPETGVRMVDKVEIARWLDGLGGWSPSGHLTRCTIWHPGAAAPAMLAAFQAIARPDVPGSPLGNVPRSLDPADLAVGEWGPWDFEIKSERPRLRRPGGVLAGAVWSAVWFAWDETSDPRGDIGRWRARAETPLAAGQVGSWATPWGEAEEALLDVGREHFGLIAHARAKLAGGRYRLTLLSDDGVRFFVDDVPVLQNWTWHPATHNSVEFELSEGAHAFRIEYFQIDGPAELLLDLDPLPGVPQASVRR